ncbi:MAG: hypothetical protein PHZ09_12960, partial [Eubacteriales bacterium]|nr:hypothetical protein [Eubacteriales bacterium]
MVRQSQSGANTRRVARIREGRAVLMSGRDWAYHSRQRPVRPPCGDNFAFSAKKISIINCCFDFNCQTREKISRTRV